MGCAASSSSTLTVSSCREDPSTTCSSASSVAVTKCDSDTVSSQWSSAETPDWTPGAGQPAGDWPRADDARALKLVSLTSLERYPERVCPQQPRHYRRQRADLTKPRTGDEEGTAVPPTSTSSDTSPGVLVRQSFPPALDPSAPRRSQYRRGPPCSSRDSSSLPLLRRFRCSIKFLPPLRFRKVRSDEPICRAFRPVELPRSRHFLGHVCAKTSSDLMDAATRVTRGAGAEATEDLGGCSSTDVEEHDQEMSDFELESEDNISSPEIQTSEASSLPDSIGPTRIASTQYAHVLSSDSIFGDRREDVTATEDSKYSPEDAEADQASLLLCADTLRSPSEDSSSPSVMSLLDQVDGCSSSADMSDISSAYPMSSDSDSVPRDPGLSDEGFSDASCTLGPVDLSGLRIMPTSSDPVPKPVPPGPKSNQPANTPILHRGGISAADPISKRDRGLGDNLKSSASSPLSAAASPFSASWGSAIGKSASLGTNRFWTKRSPRLAASSMVSGDHIQACDPSTPECGYANIHLHVDFFNDFGDNFDDELDFL